MTFKIGDILYRFDGNYRVYPKREEGGLPRGGPIYREHFRPSAIIGETRLSWVIDGDYKVSKRDMSCPAAKQCGGRGIFTLQEMEDDIWSHEHRHKIGRLIEMCDIDKLKKVAELLEYKSN